MEYDFDWVDAFSEAPFGGNGCAVVHGGAGLPEAICTAYVRETSLVECTFTGPSEVADVRVRYYLASREIPFAGHPTLATVAALRHRGLISDGALTLETGAGIVPVEVSGNRVSMTQVAPRFGVRVPKAVVAAVGGLAPEEILHTPRLVSTGLPFCITLVRDRATLERVSLNAKALNDYFAHLGEDRSDTMEPYWITLEGATAAGDTFARLLLAPPSPAEDPFTGSATGAAAAYLWSEGLIERPAYRAEQGHGLGRPGLAEVRVLGPRDAIEGVEVSGAGALVMSGKVFLPAG